MGGLLFGDFEGSVGVECPLIRDPAVENAQERMRRTSYQRKLPQNESLKRDLAL